MSDGNAEHITFAVRAGERRFGVLDAHVHWLANILQSGIAHERTRQQARLAENLKSIADAEHQPATLGKLTHRFHYGRELRDGPGAQIIAVRKASGNDDGIAIFEIMRLVPQERNWLLEHVLDCPVSVVITVGARKNDDAKLHGLSLNPSL